MKPTLILSLILLVFGCTKNDNGNSVVTEIELAANKTEVQLDNINTSDTILITSNTAWTVSVDTTLAWISVTPTADSGSVELVITSTKLNNTGSDRSQQIQVISNDGSKSVTIAVLQKYVLVPLGFAFGGEGNDVFTYIERTSEFDYLVVGYTESTQGDITINKGGKDVWVMRITPAGEKVWSKTFGGSADDMAHMISNRFDGTFMILAETNSSDGDVSQPFGGKDAWLIIINEAGEMIWEKTLGTAGDDAITHVEDGANPGFVFTGVSQGDQWMGRITSDASIIWEKRFGSSGEDVGVSVTESLDGLIFCGYGSVRDGDVPDKPTENTSDAWITLTDNDGNIQWTKYVGGENTETPVLASWMDNGTVIVYGNTNSADEFPEFSGVQNIFQKCFDKTGAELWKKLVKHSDWDEMTGFARARHRQPLIFGKTLVDNTGGQPKFDAAIWVGTEFSGETWPADVFPSAYEEEIFAITRGATLEFPIVGSTTTYPDAYGNSVTNSSGWFYTWIYPKY
jgi:hypothetical protein